MTNPSRGEIWFIDFDPPLGAEIKKTRPAVVISVDSVGCLPLRIVVPITSWKPEYGTRPWLVYLSPNARNGLERESAADCFQVKSVTLERFRRKAGSLTRKELDENAHAIALCVGLP